MWGDGAEHGMWVDGAEHGMWVDGVGAWDGNEAEHGLLVDEVEHGMWCDRVGKWGSRGWAMGSILQRCLEIPFQSRPPVVLTGRIDSLILLVNPPNSVPALNLNV
jgi:hypothetical protein